MFRQWFENFLCVCWSSNIDEDDAEYPHSWSTNLAPYSGGSFSMAVVQANGAVEDKCQVETGADSLFVGVYDGHGGNHASEFINTHLFRNLTRHIPHLSGMSEQILRTAVTETENGFMTFAENGFEQNPELGRVGSCCLAGFLWRGANLFVANLGDSRAVMGYVEGGSNRIRAEQLTRDHNARNRDIQQELKEAHPGDPRIVSKINGHWRVKGIIQVSRAIGDAYLKRLPFTLRSTLPMFHTVPPPFTQAVISSEPEMLTRQIVPNDRFVIFASDGLWELLTNQQAVDIVDKNPRIGIAKRLIKAALRKAAYKHRKKYRELRQITPGSGSDNTTRRFYHDDITVIVIFIDYYGAGNPVPSLSYKGFSDATVESDFKDIQP